MNKKCVHYNLCIDNKSTKALVLIISPVGYFLFDIAVIGHIFPIVSYSIPM